MSETKQTFTCKCGNTHERVTAVDGEMIGYISVCDPCYDKAAQEWIALQDDTERPQSE